MLNEEQVRQIKKQLLSQIEKFPEQQREAARSQIDLMNARELEEFLIKNRLIREGSEENKVSEKSGCIFCSIIQGKAPAYRIDENKKSIAVLEIAPLSRGHSLVLSKEHKKLPSSAFSLANKLGKRIKSKLKPEEVKIENAQILGHNLIQIVPIYKNQALEKKQAEEKELILLQDKLKSKPGKPKEKKPEISEIKLEKAPRRTP